MSIKKQLLLIIFLCLSSISLSLSQNAPFKWINAPEPYQGQYEGSPIEYKGNLYLKYNSFKEKGENKQSGIYTMLAFDGNKMKVIKSPLVTSTSKGNKSKIEYSYIGEPIVFEGKLFVRYDEMQFNVSVWKTMSISQSLFTYDGTTLKKVPLPENVAYIGKPVILNDALYFIGVVGRQYSGDDNLYKYQNGKVTVVKGTEDIYYFGSFPYTITYNNRIYIAGKKGDDYQLVIYDGKKYTTRKDILAYSTVGIMDGKLYLEGRRTTVDDDLIYFLYVVSESGKIKELPLPKNYEHVSSAYVLNDNLIAMQGTIYPKDEGYQENIVLLDKNQKYKTHRYASGIEFYETYRYMGYPSVFYKGNVFSKYLINGGTLVKITNYDSNSPTFTKVKSTAIGYEKVVVSYQGNPIIFKGKLYLSYQRVSKKNEKIKYNYLFEYQE